MTAASVPVVIEAPRSFIARHRVLENEQIRLGRVLAPPNHAYGLAGPSLKGSGNVLFFNLVVAGQGTIIQDDRRSWFDSGDFVFYASDRPHELHFTSEHEVIGVAVPTARLGAYGRFIDVLTATRISSNDPVVSAVGTSVEAFERNIAAVGASDRTRFLEHVVHAIETLSRHLAVEFKLIEPRRAAFLDSAEEVIRTNLADPDLSPAMIASELSVSLRTLYSVFDHAETSVAGTIRRLRLDKCVADLIDPSQRHQPVGRIGAKWGFTSPSHFSAMFRRHYGVSPTEYRHLYSEVDDVDSMGEFRR